MTYKDAQACVNLKRSQDNSRNNIHNTVLQGAESLLTVISR